MAGDGEGLFELLLGPEVPTQKFAPGEVVFREGDPGRELFVIARGNVEIRSGNRLLETLGEGDIFGEMALIDDEPRSATVVAADETTLVPVSEKQFLFLVRHTPYFALRVMRVIADRLRRQNKAM